jgi:hypothetical protein
MQYLTDHDLTGERGAHQRLRLQVPTLARVGSQRLWRRRRSRMSSPQNWRGTSKTIAWEGARWSGSSGQALQLLKTVRNVPSRGVRVVPVTNEIATQPLIEGG